jgi:V/A-type H+/Na+-transporting ATPase subunit D
MSKIKLTKGELKKQRDALKQYQHYLPTLQLKKQQLQKKILEIRHILDKKTDELDQKYQGIKRWYGLLADPFVDPQRIKYFLTPLDVVVDDVNVAGADIFVLREVKFPEPDYDLYRTPLWVDRGIEYLRAFFTLFIELQFIRKQIAILQRELRVTTQRVNLFEKVKIPESLENIRAIRIYLGDQQASAVGISKVAKKKIEIRELLEA